MTLTPGPHCYGSQLDQIDQVGQVALVALVAVVAVAAAVVAVVGWPREKLKKNFFKGSSKDCQGAVTFGKTTHRRTTLQ
jgi:hypothetical protein